MDKKIAVITGASSGIGSAIAGEYRSNGFFIVCLSRTKPDEGVVDKWIQTDITSESARAAAVAELNELGCDVLINNAGVGLYESWEEGLLEDVRRMFELNFFSVVDLTREMLPLIKKSQGSVVNISSVAGVLYVPCMGAYCATKAAVSMFSHSLRVEVKRYGVSVMDVVVGRINTGFSSRSYGGKKPPSSPGGGDPKKLAAKIYTSYMKKKRRLVYPAWYRLAFFVAKLLPQFYDNENAKRWELK